MILFLRNHKHLPTVLKGRNLKASLVYRSTRSSSSDNQDEYMQNSRLPTMYFQKSLPRLPIPKLEDSCRRYLNAQQPILSDDEFKKTTDYITEFLKKDGPKLHGELVKQDKINKHTSYISDVWFDMYLKDRRPLPINYNPFLIFVQEKNHKYNLPLIKSTNLLISSARFIKSLDAGILEPEVYHLDPKKSDTDFFRNFTKFLPTSIATYGAYIFKAFPLDMSQYKNLFRSTRIPILDKDKICQYPDSKHVVVMRRGYFYSFDLFDMENKIKSPQYIATCLKTILSDSRPANEHPIGVLTSGNRDNWAKTRQHLLKIGNDNVVNKIDSAVFVLSIDDDDLLGENYNNMLRKFLHSNGTNRWFDKSFSLLISGDGFAGINFEHSWGDGVAVLRFFKDIKNDIENKPRFHPDDIDNISINEESVEKLNFNIDETIKSKINEETDKFFKWTDNLSLDHLVFDEFGKNDCKKFGVSPDAVMQLAFQLALFKRDNCSVATYESCSTAAFKHGRTETIRSCTNQTKALCSAIIKNNKSTKNDVEFKNLIIECSKMHNILTKQAAMGQGFDRHFFMLKNISQLNGNVPSVFSDPAYAKINHNILSTSTLSSPEVLAGGFGPVVPNGYGIGYMIQNDWLGSVITSYQNHRDASEYVHHLKSAFQDIHRILKSN